MLLNKGHNVSNADGKKKFFFPNIILVYKRFPQPLVQKGKPYYMYNHIDIILKL